MKTERLELDSALYDKSINRAAEILKNEGIVGIPTETVYGLAASAYSPSAVNKVFEAKGRPQDNPLIVHISDIEMLGDVAGSLNELAKKCAKAFWPGPFTMVLNRSDNIPSVVSAGLDTVAVRMPDSKVARDIIRSAGIPLAAPSANISGSPSPTSPEHVLKDLDGKIDAVIMGDESNVGVESTVISLCTNPPRLLRPGGITVEQLREILPDLVIDSAVLKEPEDTQKVSSPGMKYKHYAPQTETLLVQGSSDNYAKFVNSKSNSIAVCFDEEIDKISIEKISYGSLKDLNTLAHNVFSVLRLVDEKKADKVYIHAPKKQGVGLAVYNRLIRAAGFKVINLGKTIGLTGPTGAGKSTASAVAENMGIQVIDCDSVAREAVLKGSDGLFALQKAFGEDILLPSGELDRKILAQKAFSSEVSTELLNNTLLPFVVKLVEEKIEKDIVLLDAPTLFESGLNLKCDYTIAVLSAPEIRLKRIMERDSISEKEALLRMNAGKKDDFYKKNADYIIYNNADEKALTAEFEKILGGL